MDDVEAWRDFGVAMVGAAAALAGLVIVAASVNISDIVKAPSLTARLGSAISGLVLAIVVSAVGLIPDIALGPYGVTTLVASVCFMVFPIDVARRVYGNTDPGNRARAGKVAIGLLAPVSYAAGSILLIAGAPTGLVFFAAGAIVAIMAALLISWVVLVEVLR